MGKLQAGVQSGGGDAAETGGQTSDFGGGGTLAVGSGGSTIASAGGSSNAGVSSQGGATAQTGGAAPSGGSKTGAAGGGQSGIAGRGTGGSGTGGSSTGGSGTGGSGTGGSGTGQGGSGQAGNAQGGTGQAGASQGAGGNGGSVQASDPGTCTKVIAESAADFSDTQGTHSWQYGYYAASTGMVSSKFTEMTLYQPCTSLGENAWQESKGWAAISAHKAHPNGALTSTLADEQWSVRRWVSTVDGIVMVSGTFNKDVSSLAGGSGPNGVTGHILVGDEEVWSLHIANNQVSPASYQFWVNVHVGDTVNFALDSYLGNDWSDATDWDCIITAC